jgi:hypothetical protein
MLLQVDPPFRAAVAFRAGAVPEPCRLSRTPIRA